MSDRERILLVEDDEGMRVACRKYLESAGFGVLEAASPKLAESILLREKVDLVITDLRMPAGGGEAVLKTVRSIVPGLPIVIITAYPTVKSAIDLFKSGILDYLIKPFTGEQLLACVEKVLLERRGFAICEGLRSALATESVDAEIAGNSAGIRRVLAEIRRVAPMKGSVLVTGESGLLKVRVGRAIHRHSARAARPFVIVNCELLPPDLLLADLFGYEGRAFAGRPSSISGLAEEANGGTLFFDEIGCLTLETQALVLKLMEEGVVRKVGGAKRTPIDVRILASSSRDLGLESQAARFREDLYARLTEFKIFVPPLRERPQDIPALAVQVLDGLNSMPTGRTISGFSTDALSRLSELPWPGNLRELQVAVQRAYARASGPLITVRDIAEIGALTSQAGLPSQSPARDEARARFDREHLAQALARHGGNVTKSAEALGIHRTTLQRLMKRHGLEK